MTIFDWASNDGFARSQIYDFNQLYNAIAPPPAIFTSQSTLSIAINIGIKIIIISLILFNKGVK